MRASGVVVGLGGTDDEVLMARFVAGHQEAFTELYDRYESELFSFCMRMLGDADQADDAFQDTFITLIDQRFRYRERGRMRAWLFTVARNVCLDRARLTQRRSRLLSLHAAGEWSSPRGIDETVESRDELSRVLAALPPDQREILLLHRHAGFSYSEIAQMTSSTESAVKQKAYRAVLTLRSEGRK